MKEPEISIEIVKIRDNSKKYRRKRENTKTNQYDNLVEDQEEYQKNS